MTCSQSLSEQGKHMSVKYFVQLSVCMAVCVCTFLLIMYAYRVHVIYIICYPLLEQAYHSWRPQLAMFYVIFVELKKKLQKCLFQTENNKNKDIHTHVDGGKSRLVPPPRPVQYVELVLFGWLIT